MSLADKFEVQRDPGFVRGLDGESARRQLRLSVFLVMAMASAAFILGFAVPVDKYSHAVKAPPIASEDAAFSGRLVGVN